MTTNGAAGLADTSDDAPPGHRLRGLLTVPTPLLALLSAEESPIFYVQPIRHANGMGVWMIMGLGVVFCVASFGALAEVAGHLCSDGATLATVVAAAIAVLFALFSVVLLVWPLLSFRRMRRTHVLMTQTRLFHIVVNPQRQPVRVTSWRLSECGDAHVARTRGRSATLVLRERVRERKSDGRTIYEWEAIHGIPRANEALALLQAHRHGGG